MSSNGYGRVWIKNPPGCHRRGYHKVATRHVWEEAYGPIPEGQVVRHRCDNPPCVRLSHLELGTQSDNMKDASKRGRTRGTIPKSIPDETLQAVPRLLAQGLSMRATAKVLGISHATVSRVMAGKERSPYG